MARKKKAKQGFIAAGEFDGDQSSTSSTGKSRSLGWGTFTEAGVSSENVDSTPTDLEVGVGIKTDGDDVSAETEQVETTTKDRGLGGFVPFVAGESKPAAGEKPSTVPEVPEEAITVDANSSALPTGKPQDDVPQKSTSNPPEPPKPDTAQTEETKPPAKVDSDAGISGSDNVVDEEKGEAVVSAMKGLVTDFANLETIANKSKSATNPPSKDEPKVPETTDAVKEKEKEKKDGREGAGDSKSAGIATAGAAIAGAAINAAKTDDENPGIKSKELSIDDSVTATKTEATSADNNRELPVGEAATEEIEEKPEIQAKDLALPTEGQGLSKSDKDKEEEKEEEKPINTDESLAATSTSRSLAIEEVQPEPEKTEGQRASSDGEVVVKDPGTLSTIPPKDVPAFSDALKSTSPDATEEDRSRNAVIAAGGPGAAALVMSRGPTGTGGSGGGADAADASSQASSQHKNYLPADLGGSKGLAGDGNPPREIQGPVPVSDGAVDQATRDMKGIAISKDAEDDENSDEDRKKKWVVFWVILCCCLIIAAIILAIIFGRDDDDDSPNADRGIGDIDTDGFVDPTPSPVAPTVAPTQVPTSASTYAPTASPVAPLNPLPVLDGGITDELFGSSISFSSDGNVLAVGGLDGWTVYDAGDDATTWTPRVTTTDIPVNSNDEPKLVALDSNGDSVWVADDGGARIRSFRWDGSAWSTVGNIISDFTLRANVLALVVSGDGMTTAVGGEGSIQVFHYIPGSNRHFPRGQQLTGDPALGSKLALDLTGRHLAASSSSTGEVSVFEWDYNTNTWNPLGNPILSNSNSPIDSLAMSSIGNVIAFGTGGAAFVYEYVDDVWVIRGTPMRGSDPSFGKSLAMSGDASLIVVGANESDEYLEDAGEVRFYGFSGGDWILSYDTTYGIAAKDRWGTSVEVSRDGRIIAIGADQKDQLPLTGYVGIFIRKI